MIKLDQNSKFQKSFENFKNQKVHIFQTKCYPDKNNQFSRFTYSCLDLDNDHDIVRVKKASKKDQPSLTIKIDFETKKQIIRGFGGALTDAACINLKKLPENLANELCPSRQRYEEYEEEE